MSVFRCHFDNFNHSSKGYSAERILINVVLLSVSVQSVILLVVILLYVVLLSISLQSFWLGIILPCVIQQKLIFLSFC